MAFGHGKDSVFKLDDAAGTLRDISVYIDNCDAGFERAMGKTTTFGKSAETYVPGLRDGKISIKGNYDSTVTTGPDVVLAGLLNAAASSTFEYGPEGGTAGKIKYTGECWLTNYKASSPVGGIVTFTADLQCTDTVTRTTF